MPTFSSNLLPDVLRTAILFMQEHGIDASKVRILLSGITGLSIPALPLSKDKVLSEKQMSLLDTYLARLQQHEPVQYILGKTEFFGMMLMVNPHVLIPRPETEGLVEWIFLKEPTAVSILDIGTGCGTIALALKNLNPEYKVTATDISEQAIETAKQNAEKLKLDINFVKSDLYPEKAAKFDIIVSNPPYVSTKEYENLDAEILLYEPKSALHAGKKGTEFYERILLKASDHLSNRGKLYFEIGETQAEAVRKIATDIGFTHFELKKDLAGRDRYLRIGR